MPRAFDPVRSRIRAVLVNDWDPADAARFEAAGGEYDGYVEPLYALLRSGADEEAVVSFLHEREREAMCFPSLGTRRLRPIARKLLAAMAVDAAPPSAGGSGLKGDGD